MRRLGFLAGLWSLPVCLLRGESRGRFRQKLALFPDDGRYSRLSHRLFATGGGLCAGCNREQDYEDNQMYHLDNDDLPAEGHGFGPHDGEAMRDVIVNHLG